MAFHSELCSPETYRFGVGLSRTAETLLNGIRALEDEKFEQIIVPEVLRRVKAEANDLKPALEILHFDKGGPIAKRPGFGPIRSSTSSGQTRTPQEVKDAAEKLHRWLSLPTSQLRAFLAIVAGKGAFWSAHVADRTARASVSHRPASAEEFVGAAQARAGSAADVAEAVDEGAGLVL